MPNLTPTALAFELARARRDGISDATTLLDALARSGQSPTVAASALAGMLDEASANVAELEIKADDEATEALARKAEPKPARSRRAPEPAAEPLPTPDGPAPAE